MKNFTCFVTGTLLAFFFSLNAHAGLITFELKYEGNPGVTGAGHITFDDTILPTTGSFGNVDASVLGITDFSLSISGASVGNGTFGLPLISEWIWVVSTPLDYSQELVGQAGFDDFNWCGLGNCDPSAPRGFGPFFIGTNYAGANGGGSDPLALVSMKQVEVTAPSTAAILIIGLAFITGRRRYKTC